jgi:transcriptional regulator with XRE-family HTH domain
MRDNLIREFRERRGMTMEEFAERAGVTRQHISRMERGERKVSLDQLDHFAEILDCAPADLLGRSERPVAIPYLGDGLAGKIVTSGINPQHFSFDFNPDEHFLIEMKDASEGFHVGDHLICKKVPDPFHALNKKVVVKIKGERNRVIGQLIAGRSDDLYTLVRQAQTMTDVDVIDTAAIVWKFSRIG